MEEKSIWGHLSELRSCLIRVALGLLLGFLLSLSVSKQLLAVITANAGQLVFLRPAEALVAQLKVALVNGILISLPVTLWQIGAFFWPALYPRERKCLILALPFAFLLFATGLGFGYFVVVRVGYKFLLSFATPQLQPMISIDTYLNFVLTSMLVCAGIFLFPLVIVILAKLGLITTGFLWRRQRIIILGLTFILALITPTVDIFSLVLVLAPLLVLFEFSVFLTWLIERGKRKKELSVDS